MKQDGHVAAVLIVSIVDRGVGSQVRCLFSDSHVMSHYQCAGHGTATSEVLDTLGLDSTEKDVILSISSKRIAGKLMNDLNNELRHRIPGRGIVMMLPFSGLNSYTATALTVQAKTVEAEGEESMENRAKDSLVLLVVNQGYTDEVMETATAAGARGGTVVRARWSGAEEVAAHYKVSMQEEKEIIGIVVPTEMRNRIMELVNEKHGLRTEASAMISSLPIEQMIRL